MSFLTAEDWKILQDVSSLLKLTGEPTVTNCVYYPPSELMRQRANQMDFEDEVIRRYRDLLRRLSTVPNVLCEGQAHEVSQPVVQSGDYSTASGTGTIGFSDSLQK